MRHFHQLQASGSAGRFTLQHLNDDMLTMFCYSDSSDFTQLPRLLHSFNHDDDETKLNAMLVQFNAVRYTLKSGCDPNSQDSFEQMMIAWDTGASFGLMPF